VSRRWRRGAATQIMSCWAVFVKVWIWATLAYVAQRFRPLGGATASRDAWAGGVGPDANHVCTKPIPTTVQTVREPRIAGFAVPRWLAGIPRFSSPHEYTNDTHIHLLGLDVPLWKPLRVPLALVQGRAQCVGPDAQQLLDVLVYDGGDTSRQTAALERLGLLADSSEACRAVVVETGAIAPLVATVNVTVGHERTKDFLFNAASYDWIRSRYRTYRDVYERARSELRQEAHRVLSIIAQGDDRAAVVRAFRPFVKNLEDTSSSDIHDLLDYIEDTALHGDVGLVDAGVVPALVRLVGGKPLNASLAMHAATAIGPMAYANPAFAVAAAEAGALEVLVDGLDRDPVEYFDDYRMSRYYAQTAYALQMLVRQLQQTARPVHDSILENGDLRGTILTKCLKLLRTEPLESSLRRESQYLMSWMGAPSAIPDADDQAFYNRTVELVKQEAEQIAQRRTRAQAKAKESEAATELNEESCAAVAWWRASLVSFAGTVSKSEPLWKPVLPVVLGLAFLLTFVLCLFAEAEMVFDVTLIAGEMIGRALPRLKIVLWCGARTGLASLETVLHACAQACWLPLLLALTITHFRDSGGTLSGFASSMALSKLFWAFGFSVYAQVCMHGAVLFFICLEFPYNVFRNARDTMRGRQTWPGVGSIIFGQCVQLKWKYHDLQFLLGSWHRGMLGLSRIDMIWSLVVIVALVPFYLVALTFVFSFAPRELRYISVPADALFFCWLLSQLFDVRLWQILASSWESISFDVNETRRNVFLRDDASPIPAETGDICMVCHEAYEPGEALSWCRFGCRQVNGHEECVAPWMEKNPACLRCGAPWKPFTIYTRMDTGTSRKFWKTIVGTILGQVGLFSMWIFSMVLSDDKLEISVWAALLECADTLLRITLYASIGMKIFMKAQGGIQ